MHSLDRYCIKAGVPFDILGMKFEVILKGNCSDSNGLETLLDS